MIEIIQLERDNRPLLEATFSYLIRQEATHCLQIGIFLPFAQGTSGDSHWWIARDNGTVVGVASRTPPHNVIVSIMASDEAVPQLAAAIRENFPDLPGVIGPNPWSQQFAEAWAIHPGIGVEPEMREAVYECTEVTFPEQMNGSARFANDIDIPWLIPWIGQFNRDAAVTDPAPDIEGVVRRRLATGGYVLWLNDDGDVVGLAGFGNPTPNGMRIGPVYTPQAQRNRGYGVAVSATVTQHLLDSGCATVFLFADLDNPISNHVYRKIGYRVVADFAVFRFRYE